PPAFTHKNCSSTSESSTIWHIVRSIPHRRCTCSDFNCNPGISRNSARRRLSGVSCGTTTFTQRLNGGVLVLPLASPLHRFRGRSHVQGRCDKRDEQCRVQSRSLLRRSSP